LPLWRHPREQHPPNLGAVGGEVEGEQPDGEQAEDRSDQAARRAQQIPGVLLQVLGDVLGRLPRLGRVGGGHHRGVEMLLSEGVELADPARQLGGDLVDLAGQHRADPDTEDHEQQQDAD
jgi:hypothetical protein